MQVIAAEGEYLAHPSLLHQLPGSEHGGEEAVVVGHLQGEAGALNSLLDAQRLLQAHGQGLVDVYVLARLQGLQGHGQVQGVGGADGHCLHLGHGQQLVEIVGIVGEACVLGGLAGYLQPPGTHALQHGAKVRLRIEQAHFPQCVGVGLAHEAPAYHAHADLPHRRFLLHFIHPMGSSIGRTSGPARVQGSRVPGAGIQPAWVRDYRVGITLARPLSTSYW